MTKNSIPMSITPKKAFSAIFTSSSTWVILLFIVILLLIIVSLFKKPAYETFINQDQKFEQKSGEELYDDFYADVYDSLVYSHIKNEYEVGRIDKFIKPTQESKILDIGSGTGHHVELLKQRGSKAIGLDNSKAMIKKAKENYPDNEYVLGNALDTILFQPNSFTNILCLYFTIYYIKDKQTFLNNCFSWLMPGGTLIIHLVDKEMFDPIIPPANPLLLVSPQKYAEDRITTSNVTFNNFKYSSNFVMDDDNDTAKFVERFKNKDTDKTFRKNEHIMYMEDQGEILSMAQNLGFIILGKIDMVKAQYEYQYLYILQKPE